MSAMASLAAILLVVGAATNLLAGNLLLFCPTCDPG